jgi:site-specific DNA-methyltransferase (adenine-specific)
MLNELYLSECFEKIKTLPDNSVGSIVSDPPYLIDFMNKKWDSQDSPVGKKEFWLEVKRVLKPGAHAAIFGHSRTHHRVMVAMEDAGFEIRDTMMWLYGSGFPKSHNISKAIDKLEGKEPKVVGERITGNARTKEGWKGGQTTIPVTEPASSAAKDWEGWGTALKPAYEPIIIARKPIEKGLSVAQNVLKWGVGGINIDGCRVGTEQMPAITTKTETTAIGWEKKGYTTPAATGRFPANVMLSHHPDCKKVGEVEEELPAIATKTETTAMGWEKKGYTTPAVSSTTAVYDCVDDCPAKLINDQSGIVKGGKSAPNRKQGFKKSYVGDSVESCKTTTTAASYDDTGGAARFFENHKWDTTGRFPANVMISHHPDCEKVGVVEDTRSGGNTTKEGWFSGTGAGAMKATTTTDVYDCHEDCPAKILDDQSGNVGGGNGKPIKAGDFGKNGVYGKAKGATTQSYKDKGGASRFFYCPKVSKKERSVAGKNNHPTVKPIALMRYLIRLITPSGEICLDPFMGSGSTGMAAVLEGRDFIGIEMSEDYLEIAKARIEWAKKEAKDANTRS